jgi:hypothetical protein
MPQRAERELLKRYRDALRAYIQANTSIEGLSGPDFDEAYQRAEEARAEFEKVRQELLEFRAQGEGA